MDEKPRGDDELESLGDVGGDDVCWAHLLCPECGIVVNERAEHREGCTVGTVDSAQAPKRSS